MFDPTVTAAIVAAVTALVVSSLGAWLTYLAARKKLDEELKLEHAAEKAIRILFSRGWNLRSFETMKAHLPGFDDDELRQLLIRSGAIAFQSSDLEKKEYWGLAENNLKLLAYSTGNTNFKLVGDPPVLTKTSSSIARNGRKE